VVRCFEGRVENAGVLMALGLGLRIDPLIVWNLVDDGSSRDCRR